MGTQKHDDAPEPQSPERRSPPTVNEIVEELKSLPLNVGSSPSSSRSSLSRRRSSCCSR